MMSENEPEHGPVYGVELPRDFPLGPAMLQACPGASELEQAVHKGFTRVVAAYEIALSRLAKAEAELADMRNTLSAAVIADIRSELQVPDGRSVVEVATERMGEIRELRSQINAILHPPVLDRPDEPGWWAVVNADGEVFRVRFFDAPIHDWRRSLRAEWLSGNKVQRITLPTPGPATTTNEVQP